jgi:hypothetical protein
MSKLGRRLTLVVGMVFASGAMAVSADAASYSNAVLGDGVGVYYRLDETASQVQVVDSSTTSATQRHNGTYASGTRGLAGAITDGDTAVGAPNFAASFSNESEHSVEFWIKDVPTGTNRLITHGVDYLSAQGTVPNGWQLYTYLDQGNRKLGIYLTGQNFELPCAPPSGSAWQMYDITWTSSTVNCYVDGALGGSVTAPQAVVGAPTATAPQFTVNTPATFDEVALYPSTLSAAQVAAHYHAGLQPFMVTGPAITGTVKDTYQLTNTGGTWRGAGIAYTYAWQRCSTTSATSCSAIAGQTTTTYDLTAGDIGSYLRATVTAVNSHATIGPVGTTIVGPVTAAAPRNLRAPSLIGFEYKDASLQIDRGDWAGTAPLGYGYQWERCDSTGTTCFPVAGATSASYTPVGEDLGSRLRALVTVTNTAGTVALRTPITGVILDMPTIYGDGSPCGFRYLCPHAGSGIGPERVDAISCTASVTVCRTVDVLRSLADACWNDAAQCAPNLPTTVSGTTLSGGSGPSVDCVAVASCAAAAALTSRANLCATGGGCAESNPQLPFALNCGSTEACDALQTAELIINSCTRALSNEYARCETNGFLDYGDTTTDEVVIPPDAEDDSATKGDLTGTLGTGPATVTGTSRYSTTSKTVLAVPDSGVEYPLSTRSTVNTGNTGIATDGGSGDDALGQCGTTNPYPNSPKRFYLAKRRAVNRTYEDNQGSRQATWLFWKFNRSATERNPDNGTFVNNDKTFLGCIHGGVSPSGGTAYRADAAFEGMTIQAYEWVDRGDGREKSPIYHYPYLGDDAKWPTADDFYGNRVSTTKTIGGTIGAGNPAFNAQVSLSSSETTYSASRYSGNYGYHSRLRSGRFEELKANAAYSSWIAQDRGSSHHEGTTLLAAWTMHQGNPNPDGVYATTGYICGLAVNCGHIQ